MFRLLDSFAFSVFVVGLTCAQLTLLQKRNAFGRKFVRRREMNVNSLFGTLKEVHSSCIDCFRRDVLISRFFGASVVIRSGSFAQGGLVSSTHVRNMVRRGTDMDI